MTLIIDPDDLNQGTEVTINTSAKTIALSVAGNLSNDVVTGQALYSFLKEEWIVPTGLYSSSESFTDSKTSILLGGGVSGEEYTLTNRIETSAGQIEDRSMIIKCGQK